MDSPTEAPATRGRFHSLAVKRVVVESEDAVSIAFDVPEELAEHFAYQPGQFVMLRVLVDGEPQVRSYSMSSAPPVDTDLTVTVKKVPGGVVSPFLVDTLAEGDRVEVGTPRGAFVLSDAAEDLVGFAAGSGITPMFSLVKAALYTTDRRVRLLFANEQRSAAIFGAALDDLRRQFPDRLFIEHHEDVVSGFVDVAAAAAFVGDRTSATFYICGPTGFMDIVETALLEAGVERERIHIERFTAPTATAPKDEPALADEASAPAEVTITVGSQTKTLAQRGRLTVLESARWSGLPAPSSCESGHCATCMARLVEGEVDMAVNDVLTDDEVTEGWILTCQSVPVSPVVRVVYET